MVFRFWMRGLPGLGVALAASALIAAPAQAAGGLFGLLFGNPAPPPPTYYAPQPFEMTVKGHKRKSSVSARKPKEGEEEKSHAHLQQPLDPAGDSEWFLKDPTLRRGDIIVLSNRVVVYTGGRGQPRMADFSSLYGNALVSKKDQEKVRGITQAPAEALVRYQTLPAPSSTAAAAVERAGFSANPVASTEALRP